MIGYVRVSKENGADVQLGLLAQRSAIEAWGPVTHFEEDVLSGASLARPALQCALEDCDAGRADGIVVAKLDRLSRSVIDFAGLLARARRGGWDIVALDFGLDMRQPSGKLVANILMSVAEWERETIGARTSEALQVLKASGVKLGGSAPRIEPGVEASIRKRLELGDSRRQVCEWLNRSGVPTPAGGSLWRPSSFARIRL